MQLSVIIVNYNVRHFLEQALRSSVRAMEGIEGEIWVVDNNSVDDSVRMVTEKFPQVNIIANTQNTGFAVANNQALRLSQGKYVLLLNPDTVVEEDTFHKSLAFMETQPEAGALGVKLIDGSGNYLPESKRGFPTPWVAFCKTFGLSTIFPKSKLFNGYYLGHLSPDETHEVDVLVGCFMFMRAEALAKSGFLDEAFFMYGEDIDLSYRIVQAGYKNYYLPSTKIIHYKGESTKKGSLNYVKTFYQAMIIFAKKHFTGSQAGLFVLMLQAAIWFRASLSLLRSFFGKIWLPLLDASVIFLGLFFLKDFWANYYFKDPNYYKSPVLWFNFPLYTGIWLLSVWLNGGYDHRFDVRRLVRGLALGTLFLAAVYGFLDLEYRPSRALLLLGAAWALAATVLLRAILHFIEYRTFSIGQHTDKKLLIVGSQAESKRVRGLLNEVGVQKNFVGTVGPEHEIGDDFLSTLRQLEEVVQVYRIEEIIFCGKDIAATDILGWMTQLGPTISYKIVPEDSMSIIGSSSKNEPGELYIFAIKYNLAQSGQRRNKRFLDVLICLALPLFFIFSKKRKQFVQHWFAVFSGKKTWVGYVTNLDSSGVQKDAKPTAQALPNLQKSVFSPLDGFQNVQSNPNMIARLNFLYAKDWSIWRDLEVLFRLLG